MDVYMYPRVLIDLDKFRNNVEVVKNRLTGCDIGIFAVSKVFCCDLNLATIFDDLELDAIADSRIENLKTVQNFHIKKVLLRLPMHSEIEDTVKYSDISLNSEISTLELLSKEAVRQSKTHGAILMYDLGDLREGYFDKNELMNAAEKAVQLEGIELLGIGTNLTCFGGIIPRQNHMDELIAIRNEIQNKFNIKLRYISAGNSSSYYLTQKYELPKEINNLRIGEIFVCGRETSFGDDVEGTHQDVFALEAQIVELKEKPSQPVGEIGMDAFGNTPTFENKGTMKRAIVACGRQDVNTESVAAYDKNIDVIGASSDHIILDVTKSKERYKVGDIIKFHLSYGGILSVMTSKYVNKKYIKEDGK